MEPQSAPPAVPARRSARATLVGLYGIADAAAAGGDPVALAAALLDGGCRVVQLRCKDWPAHRALAAARAIRALTRAAGAAFVANDDPHLAVAADADGLHLGQLDGPIDAARAVVGSRWIGRSTNTVDQARAAVAEGADYVAFGPVYATPHLSRPKEVRGVARLAEVRAVVPPEIPLVAIGGITAERIPEIRAAGAQAWAVIGAVASADDRRLATRALLG